MCVCVCVCRPLPLESTSGPDAGAVSRGQAGLVLSVHRDVAQPGVHLTGPDVP